MLDKSVWRIVAHKTTWEAKKSGNHTLASTAFEEPFPNLFSLLTLEIPYDGASGPLC
jgi:hypothetical protein